MNVKLKDLIKKLKSDRVLVSSNIEEALRNVDRADFVPEKLKEFSYYDEPLPIGNGQTISQPYTVTFMLEKLGVKEGEKVIDIGSGSGWQTMLLAYLVGEEGKVFAIERIPELCEIGKENISKYSNLAKQVEMECGNAITKVTEFLGRHEYIDHIIAAADISIDIPPPWLEKLREGGTFVYPSRGSLIKMTKTEKGFDTEEFPGFVFVPFVSQ